jgi:hypothetical protein
MSSHSRIMRSRSKRSAAPPEVWQSIFKYLKISHEPSSSVGCLVPILRMDKQFHVSLTLAYAAALLTDYVKGIATRVFWERLDLPPRQVGRLAHEIITSPRGVAATAIGTWTRTLRFHGIVPSEPAREALLTVFQRARNLNVLHIHPLCCDTSVLALIYSFHADTLQHLRISVPLAHSTSTFLIEKLIELRSLAVVAHPGDDSETEMGHVGRPIGRFRSFQHLVFFSFELAGNCSALQQTQIMETLSGCRFPSLEQAVFVVRSNLQADSTAEHILLFTDAHAATLTCINLHVTTSLIKLVLPYVTVANVYVETYDGSAVFGTLVSSDTSHISFGSYSGTSTEDAKCFATETILTNFLGRHHMIRYSQIPFAVRVVKLHGYAWPPYILDPDEEKDELTCILSELGRAFHNVGMRLVDRMNLDVFGQEAEVIECLQVSLVFVSLLRPF